jgi:hypothetical protein
MLRKPILLSEAYSVALSAAKATTSECCPVTCRLAIALLLWCIACSSTKAEPIIVTKPVMESPETKFDDAELQATYDEAWEAFSETVEAATDALTKELQARVQAAQDEGNLDLVKHWTGVNEQWEQTGEFEWDADEERRKWDRFAPSAFPHSVTIAARGTAATNKAAIEELRAAYKAVERALVKGADTETAEEVRQEIGGLLEANDFKNDRGKSRPIRNSRPVSKIRDQFVGEWSSPSWKYVNIYTAQKGTTDRGKVVRRQADGQITDGGMFFVNADGNGKIIWHAGRAKGWVDLVCVFPCGLLAGSGIDPKGARSQDGWVAWQKGFDWRGEQCQDVEATPEAKAAVAGEWTHPNSDLIWKISAAGDLVEQRKTGGVHSSGPWRLQTDGSYACSLSNGWRVRFWVHKDILAILPFSPEGGDLAGDGLICGRVGDVLGVSDGPKPMLRSQ